MHMWPPTLSTARSMHTQGQKMQQKGCGGIGDDYEGGVGRGIRELRLQRGDDVNVLYLIASTAPASFLTFKSRLFADLSPLLHCTHLATCRRGNLPPATDTWPNGVKIARVACWLVRRLAAVNNPTEISTRAHSVWIDTLTSALTPTERAWNCTSNVSMQLSTAQARSQQSPGTREYRAFHRFRTSPRALPQSLSDYYSDPQRRRKISFLDQPLECVMVTDKVKWPALTRCTLKPRSSPVRCDSASTLVPR